MEHVAEQPTALAEPPKKKNPKKKEEEKLTIREQQELANEEAHEEFWNLACGKTLEETRAMTACVKKLLASKQAGEGGVYIYAFDPPARTAAYKVFESWCESLNMSEKIASLLLHELLAKQQYLPDKQIGDRLYKKWRDEVLAAHKGVYDGEAVPSDLMARGFLVCLLTMDVG